MGGVTRRPRRSHLRPRLVPRGGAACILLGLSDLPLGIAPRWVGYRGYPCPWVNFASLATMVRYKPVGSIVPDLACYQKAPETMAV